MSELNELELRREEPSLRLYDSTLQLWLGVAFMGGVILLLLHVMISSLLR